MIKILITGANSYVGMSVDRYLQQWPEKYHVDTVDMVGDDWKKRSFAGYDTVFHVAGIVHLNGRGSDPEREKLYDSVNTELAIETARKAKYEGVRQFVFMSSASVYGEGAPVGKNKLITKDTPTNPANKYGESKVQAEKGILPLNEDSFRVVVLRPPMIYGSGCKGNYPTLSKLATKLPAFPMVDNQRSMLYIENFVEFVRLMIENKEQGIFWPQNKEFSNTSEVVKMIAQTHGRKIKMIKGMNWALKIMSRLTGLVNKAFGSFCYDMSLSVYKEEYQRVSLTESIIKTEKDIAFGKP